MTGVLFQLKDYNPNFACPWFPSWAVALAGAFPEIEHRFLDLGHANDKDCENVLQGADFVGLHLHAAPYLPVARNTVNWIKENFNIKIVVGGQFIRNFPQVNQWIPADYFCKDLKELSGILKVPYYESWISDYSILNLEQYVKNCNEAYIVTSFGCSFSCTFCAAEKGVSIKKRCPKAVINEIECLHRAGFVDFYFVDLDFFQDIAHANKIINEIARSGLRLHFRAVSRADSVLNCPMELLELARNVGLYEVSVGIESYSDVILKKVKKGINADISKNAIHRLQNESISVNALAVLGLPGETEDSYRKLEDFLFENLSEEDSVQLFVFKALPGTVYFRKFSQPWLLNPQDWLWLDHTAPVRGRDDADIVNYWFDRFLLRFGERCLTKKFTPEHGDLGNENDKKKEEVETGSIVYQI